SVGMLFDPMILVREPLLVLATTLIIMFGKSAAAYAIVRLFGHPESTALTISASLAQIGEFAFIIAALGVTLGILPQQGQDLVLAGALITIMLNPVTFGVVDRWLARQEVRADAEATAATARAVAEDAANHHLPESLSGHAVVVGYGRVGRQLAQLLAARGVPLVVVEDDAELVDAARGAGLLAVRGNVASEPVML